MDYITEKDIKEVLQDGDYGYTGDRRDAEAYIAHLQESILDKAVQLAQMKNFVLSFQDMYKKSL